MNNCHILLVGTRNQKFDYEMNGAKPERTQCVRDLNVTIVSSFKFSGECKDAAGKAITMLDFINRNFLFKNEDVILPLHISEIRRAILGASPCKGYSEARGCPAKAYEDDYVLTE